MRQSSHASHHRLCTPATRLHMESRRRYSFRARLLSRRDSSWEAGSFSPPNYAKKNYNKIHLLQFRTTPCTNTTTTTTLIQSQASETTRLQLESSRRYSFGARLLSRRDPSWEAGPFSPPNYANKNFQQNTPTLNQSQAPETTRLQLGGWFIQPPKLCKKKLQQNTPTLNQSQAPEPTRLQLGGRFIQPPKLCKKKLQQNTPTRIQSQAPEPTRLQLGGRSIQPPRLCKKKFSTKYTPFGPKQPPAQTPPPPRHLFRARLLRRHDPNWKAYDDTHSEPGS